MKNIKIYDVHGIKVCLDSSNINLHNAIDHQLNFFQVQDDSLDESIAHIKIQDYCRKPNMKQYQTASDYYFYDNGILDIPEHRLCFDISEEVHKYYLDSFVIPVNLIVQLFLQNHGKTLVHSAGISCNGDSMLFPALGGIGKTTIVSHAMKEGCKLYGDDMCIVDKDAILYPYPIDFSVYHYHYKLLGIERSVKSRVLFVTGRALKLFDKIPIISWLTTRVRGKFFPECENISPLLIYGKNSVAKPSKMRKITYIGRHIKGEELVQHEQLTDTEMAARVTSILLSEWRDSVVFLQIYSAFSTKFSYLDMCNNINKILIDAISNTKVKSVYVDASVSNEKYIKLLWSSVIAK